MSPLPIIGICRDGDDHPDFQPGFPDDQFALPIRRVTDDTPVFDDDAAVRVVGRIKDQGKISEHVLVGYSAIAPEHVVQQLAEFREIAFSDGAEGWHGVTTLDHEKRRRSTKEHETNHRPLEDRYYWTTGSEA